MSDGVRSMEARVPMPDGVELMADVYLPGPAQGSGPWPVIIVRTPYARQGLAGVGQFAAAGYAVFIQDVRGRGASGGTFGFLAQEPADAVATARWLIDQPWCDGRFAILGISYLAAASLPIAVAFPERVKAAVWITVPVDANHLSFRHGVFRLHHSLPWSVLGRTPLNQHPWSKLYANLPVARALADHGLSSPVWDALAGGGTPDAPFWRVNDLSPLLDQVRVPGLHFGGWWDFLLDATLEPFERMRQSGVAQHLVLGPWSHNGTVSELTGTKYEEYAPDASSRFAEEARHWFDRWFKGWDGDSATPNGDAPVRAFLTGPGGGWRSSGNWPMPEGRETRLHLGSGGRLSMVAGDDAIDGFTYDPLNPVPTEGGAVWEFPVAGLEPGPAPQSSSGRPDVLTYDSDPLKAPVAYCGPLAAELHAGTDAPETALAAKLCDVDAGGTSRIVADGIAVLRRSESNPSAGFTRVRVDMGACGHVFAADHVIRLEVSSSNFPKYVRALNSGENPIFGTSSKVARQRVAHGRSHGSCLVLWELPSGGAGTGA